MNKTKINYYKTQDSIYIAKSTINYRNVRDSVDRSLKYNGGIPLEETHHPSWKLMRGETELFKVEKQLPSTKTNIRWELLNFEDTKLGLPEVLSPKEALEEWDDDDEIYAYVITSPEYARFNNLYKRKYDLVDGDWEDITDNFEFVSMGEFTIENISENFSDMKVGLIEKSGWNNKEVIKSISDVATYNELEEMIVPDLMIHNRPCKIDTNTTYKIVRNYIKNNIDLSCAKITSDYDFCFTVQRIIKIKPYVHKTEVTKSNGRSYAKPRFNSRTIESKIEKIFEMCPSKIYQHYTPINGFQGDNLADLAANIKSYLDDLMKYINTPLEECSHCNGSGCVSREDFDKNKRD